MKHLFYLIAIFFILYELLWIIEPRKRAASNLAFENLEKENKGKKWDEMSEEYKSALNNKMHLFIFTLWMFAGLFTFNWLAFVVIIIFNFTIIGPISQSLKYSNAYTILHWCNSIIGFIFGIFVIINSYHLKIDLLYLFQDYF